MTMPTPLQEGRRGGGHCLFLSPLEKSRSVVMTKLIPHPERRWARCQDPCPSTPEKEKGVIMALPIPLLEGRREGEHGLCLSPLGGRQGGVEFGHPHPREGGWASCQDLCPPIQDKARSVVMAISTPLLEGTKQGRRAWFLPLSS